jgi:hypothetical protein
MTMHPSGLSSLTACTIWVSFSARANESADARPYESADACPYARPVACAHGAARLVRSVVLRV